MEAQAGVILALVAVEAVVRRLLAETFQRFCWASVSSEQVGVKEIVAEAQEGELLVVAEVGYVLLWCAFCRGHTFPVATARQDAVLTHSLY